MCGNLFSAPNVHIRKLGPDPKNLEIWQYLGYQYASNEVSPGTNLDPKTIRNLNALPFFIFFPKCFEIHFQEIHPKTNLIN